MGNGTQSGQVHFSRFDTTEPANAVMCTDGNKIWCVPSIIPFLQPCWSYPVKVPEFFHGLLKLQFYTPCLAKPLSIAICQFICIRIQRCSARKFVASLRVIAGKNIWLSFSHIVNLLKCTGMKSGPGHKNNSITGLLFRRRCFYNKLTGKALKAARYRIWILYTFIDFSGVYVWLQKNRSSFWNGNF